MGEAAREEAEFEEALRQPAEEIKASEEVAARAAAADTDPSPDAEIAQVHIQSGRQNHHPDTAAYQRSRPGRRRGPRR
jgi:hypothetical protein